MLPRISKAIGGAAWLVVLASLATLHPAAARAADRKTVCTITVNSSDEKEAFRRNLPADRFRFVELVERGRPDWLESARRNGVHCDILIISGHYDGGDYAGGNEFFSERLDAHEYLPVDEMERVACSDPDNGMFSRLKEVYLFGCNTLNPVALRSAADEIARTLVQSGHDPADAERLSRRLSARYADSSRDRMRHIFEGVPAIYGFSSVAPLGPTAGTYLERWLRSGGAREVGSGRASARILGYFPGRSLTVTRGSTAADPDAAFRRDVCQLFDDRVSPGARAAFVHRLLERDMAEVRLFLDRLERYAAAIGGVRERPDVAQSLDAIAHDTAARDRYFAFMRSGDQPAVRARMIELAEAFGWLSAPEKRAELMRLIGDRFARDALTPADVDFACRLNPQHELDGARGGPRFAAASGGDVGHAALLACLGGVEDRARPVRALTSPRPADVQIAQVYLRHRPITDVAELREVAAGIAQMSDVDAQVRALDTLAHHRLSDPATLEEVARLFPVARSIDVQRAIAGLLLRADYQAIAGPDLARTLREHRLKSPGGRDLIDVLINQLQAAS